jgi:hypothetical protein
VEEAIKYYDAFEGGKYYIESTKQQIIVASAEHNKLDVAYDFIERRGDFSDLYMLKNAYIDSGKFEEYEKISGITSLIFSYDKREYVEFLEAWIDYLEANGRMLEAKKIIDNRLSKFDEYENPDGDHYPYQRDKVRKRLYDRAGIK